MMMMRKRSQSYCFLQLSCQHCLFHLRCPRLYDYRVQGWGTGSCWVVEAGRSLDGCELETVGKSHQRSWCLMEELSPLETHLQKHHVMRLNSSASPPLHLCSYRFLLALLSLSCLAVVKTGRKRKRRRNWRRMMRKRRISGLHLLVAEFLFLFVCFLPPPSVGHQHSLLLSLWKESDYLFFAAEEQEPDEA